MFNQRHFRESSKLNSISVSAFSPNEIADVIVALTNTNGGSLTGLSHDSQDVIAVLASQCLPAVDVEVSVLSDSIVASIPRSKEIHATPDRRVLIRSKTQNIELNGKQIRQLAQKRSIGNYEDEIVPGVNLNDLDRKLIERFCDQLEIENFTDPNDVLMQIGALDSHQQPSVAGILLFGESPQQWLPQSGVIVKRFAGKTSTKDARLIQKQEIQGNLWTILETLHEWIHGNIIQTTDSIELPSTYPASIVFEALSNAVIHRDYRLRNHIEINIYDDGLQIVSPGELPSFIKLDRLDNYCFYRNPTIAHVLSVSSNQRNTGTGVEQMKAEAAANNQISLQFTTSRNDMTVSIRQKNKALIENAQSTQSPTVNWRQERAIRYIQECGSLTYHEFHTLCPNIAHQILFSDLVDLVEKKLVIKAGTKNVFFYLQHQ